MELSCLRLALWLLVDATQRWFASHSKTAFRSLWSPLPRFCRISPMSIIFACSFWARTRRFGWRRRRERKVKELYLTKSHLRRRRNSKSSLLNVLDHSLSAPKDVHFHRALIRSMLCTYNANSQVLRLALSSAFLRFHSWMWKKKRTFMGAFLLLYVRTGAAKMA